MSLLIVLYRRILLLCTVLYTVHESLPPCIGQQLLLQAGPSDLYQNLLDLQDLEAIKVVTIGGR